MGVAVYFAYDLLFKLIKSNAIATVLCIVIGGVVYLFFLLLFRGLNEEEIKAFPKGASLARIFKKMHLLK